MAGQKDEKIARTTQRVRCAVVEENDSFPYLNITSNSIECSFLNTFHNIRIKCKQQMVSNYYTNSQCTIVSYAHQISYTHSDSLRLSQTYSRRMVGREIEKASLNCARVLHSSGGAVRTWKYREDKPPLLRSIVYVLYFLSAKRDQCSCGFLL